MTKILPNGIMVIEGDTHISKWVEETGRLDHDEGIKKICALIKPGDTVVDAGANIGSHTIAYLRAVGPSGKVVAIEPSDEAFKCLSHNCPEARLINGAIGSRFLLGSLIIPENRGAASINPDGKMCYDSFVDGSFVVVNRLDDLLRDIPKIALIKMDLEGYELQALKGSESILKRDLPILVVEIAPGHLRRSGTDFNDLFIFIWSIGYETKPLHGYDPEQYDMLCTPK